MIEFYIERSTATADLLSLDHLQSICRWERKFQDLLSLNNTRSLSLATFVALYNSKSDCRLLTAEDVSHFRSILHTCLPYYFNGYMDIPLSEQFLNRVILEHQPGYFTHQEQVKAIYTTLRHTCFYKNITRFIFDHFVDKQFLSDFSVSKNQSKVALSMIFLSNYQAMKQNRTRDPFMCLRRQPYSRKHCEERGCMKDLNNNLLVQSCADRAPPRGTCEKYCQCKYQCANETEQVVVMKPIYKVQDFIDLFEKYFAGKRQLPQYRDEFIKLTALNFANVRERAAMARISEGRMIQSTRRQGWTIVGCFRYAAGFDCNCFDHRYHCPLSTECFHRSSHHSRCRAVDRRKLFHLPSDLSNSDLSVHESDVGVYSHWHRL